MRHYRVPYLTYGSIARNKAQVASGMTAERLKKPDISWAEFDAPTHAAAQRKMQELVLPADPRPIRGRNYVSLFATEAAQKRTEIEIVIDSVHDR